MMARVIVGGKQYGGYPWSNYNLMVGGPFPKGEIEIIFQNFEFRPIYASRRGGIGTTNTMTNLRLPAEVASVLVRMLLEVLGHTPGDEAPSEPVWRGAGDFHLEPGGELAGIYVVDEWAMRTGHDRSHEPDDGTH